MTTDSRPGEPQSMVMRSHPQILRIHKFNKKKDPRDYWYSEALLYVPFQDESEIERMIDAIFEADFNPLLLQQLEDKIKRVKKQVMEYLESVEEARIMAEQTIANLETIGEDLDPEGEQELDDHHPDDTYQDPEYLHLDPEIISSANENHPSDLPFRPKDRSFKELCEEAKTLDLYQKKVLELCTNQARKIVKSRKDKNPFPDPLLLVVSGGAGSGKSRTINLIRSFLESLLCKAGDNPNQPQVCVVAPTGTAAKNVKGQTIHSEFGLSFGNEHFSLSDSLRDKKRTKYQHLRFVIIDEISMMKAGQLYQLDLRLRELTGRLDKIFGGVSQIYFGDVMQLKPCQGRYIWTEPRNSDFALVFNIQSHWHL